MRALVRMRTVLPCLCALAQAQAPADDPYTIGAALGGQGACPVFITGIVPGSPAERAGLRRADYLLAISGTNLAGITHAFDLLRAEKSPAVTLKLRRSGKEFETVVVRERRSAIMARNGGELLNLPATYLDAREPEVVSGRVVGRVFSPTRYPENPEFFYPGFEVFILRDPDQVIVAAIEDGPASRAGVRAGEAILAVDGVPVSGKTPAELERLFSSPRQRRMRLETSTRKFEFQLEKAAEVARRSGWLLSATRLIPLWAAAQDPQCFPSAREAMFDRTLGLPSAVGGGFIEAHWMEDGNSFWFVERLAAGGAIIQKYDPVAGTKTPLFDAARLRRALEPLAGLPAPGAGLPFDRFTFLPGEKAARFTFENHDFILQTDSYAIEAAAPESPADKDRRTPRFLRKPHQAGPPPLYETRSPDGRWFAGSHDGNLYLRSGADGRIQPLTSDGSKDYGWDADGVLWSPDSSWLAAAKVDERDVPLYPIVHWLKPGAEVEWVRLGYTGSGVRKPEYYVMDVNSRKAVRIDSGDQSSLYFRGWRSDSSGLLLTRHRAKQIDLLAADPKTGATRLLFTETTRTFFDLGLSLPNSPNFTPLAGDRAFLWLSERDGWNQIYLFDGEGTLIRKLTTDQRPVERIVAVDEKDGWVYYTAHGAEGRPYDFHLYRVSLRGGQPRRLTASPGQHDQSVYRAYLGSGKGEGIQFSPSRRFFLDSHSDVNRPPQTELRRADGKLLEVLAKAGDDAVKVLRPHPPEEFTAKAADARTDLYGIVYKPYDFDVTRRYPVLDAIYAGPQTTLVSRTFAGGTGAMAQAFANLGFIVFMVDARGTPDRGKEFQDVVYRNFGRNEIPDHVAVLKQLAAARPYIDLSRAGVFGASYGGYFAIRAMLQSPNVFRTGVAAAPLTDLRQGAGASTIYFTGDAVEDKDALDFASNLRLAGNLKGNLLLIHGTSDVNAPLTATLQMIDALIKAGKPYDLILLPDQDHIPAGQAATYTLQQERRYLVEHLHP